MLDSLSCSVTSISFLTTSCSFTLIVKEQLVVRTDIDVNGHEILSNITLRQTQIKVKEQLVVITDIDVNGHERLIYIYIRSYYKLFLYFNLCLSKCNVG
jgi:5S rRNA maturation endonuclease (ribonuclease M5)